METLVFSENFKGLPSGWIAISPVNFLVGENSTGKTSFFDLLEIVTSQQFLFDNAPWEASDKIQSSYDFISKISGKDHSTIGTISRIKRRSKDANGYFGKLVSYKRSGTSLKVSKITIVRERQTLSLRLVGNEIIASSNARLDEGQGIEKVCKHVYQAHSEIGNLTAKNEKAIGKIVSGIPFDFQLVRLIQEADLSLDSEQKEQLTQLFYPGVFQTLRFAPVRQETERFFRLSEASSMAEKPIKYPQNLQPIKDIKSSQFKALIRFGKQSGLFDTVKVEEVKIDAGGEIYSLMFEKYGRFFFSDELGFGVGQIMPIVTDILFGQSIRSLLIQQPEVHLHPKAQAAFGSFLRANYSKSKAIFVETHSDFIIDRFRLEQAKRKKSIGAVVNFFEKEARSNANKLHQIKIASDGQYEGMPKSFRKFFLKESLEIFTSL